MRIWWPLPGRSITSCRILIDNAAVTKAEGEVERLGRVGKIYTMVREDLKADLKRKIAEAEHPREMAVDVMTALQNDYGYLSDEALQEGAALLAMTPVELEELATFYDFIYPRAGGEIRHSRLRWHRLLDERLHDPSGSSQPEIGNSHGGNDRGWDVHPPAHSLYRILRPVPGDPYQPETVRSSDAGKESMRFFET